ncbi:hypothetical protein B6U71_05050 [Euryarchaeota archaeon ex4484_178]|nr:MAG: hypothetical protein B6U71_05050 [Euryarchaeota archaeon ex4484_178]
MSKALKFALIFAFLFTLPVLLGIYYMDGTLKGGTICAFSYIYAGLAIFFYISYRVGQAMWNTEKKIWRWMNEEKK